jgi:hypothetical protein
MRPAAPVASPAATAAFEPPPLCFCAEEDELLADPLGLEALLLEPLLRLAPLLFALVPERALLPFEALLLFVPLPLFEAVERRAELALEPLELCELFFCLLDEPVFAWAITPPWVFDILG